MIEFLPIALNLVGGLLGGLTESPQEKAVREARLRAMESASRIDELARRQRAEADKYGQEVESSRRYGAGAISGLANQEAVGLYSRLLSRQQSLMSAAMNAARAGLNTNFNPSLTEVFSDVGRAGSEVERNRGERLLQNERQSLEGQSRAQAMRQQADALNMQAEQIRQRGQEFAATYARPSTWISNVFAGANLGANLGKSVIEMSDAINRMQASQQNASQQNALTSVATLPTANMQTGITQLVADPLASYRFGSYMPYLEGGEQLRDENFRRYTLNRALYESMTGIPQLRTREDVMRDFNTTFGRTPRAPQIPQVEYRALGGRVEAGKPYIVGDSPTGVPTGNEELFIPDQSGVVIPSENTQAMMAEGKIANAQADGGTQMQGNMAEGSSPRMAFMKSLLEEISQMSAEDDEIASRILEGTGLENLLLGKRKSRRKKAIEMILK